MIDIIINKVKIINNISRYRIIPSTATGLLTGLTLASSNDSRIEMIFIGIFSVSKL